MISKLSSLPRKSPKSCSLVPKDTLSQVKQFGDYSKHPHIRTLFSGLRLIMFLFEGCLVRNQPESVLKMFLKLVSEILQIKYY